MRRNRNGFDPDYLEFIELFNQGRYEESHEVLLGSWQRNRTNDFFKGLIQIAGAFQHWDAGSLFWAEDLFATAHNLLVRYAPRYMGLDVERVLADLQAWNQAARRARTADEPVAEPPRLRLHVDTGQD